MAFTIAQKKALSIAPHITGSASMIGSGCIIRSIVVEMRSGNSVNTYQRLLLGMSCIDLITSFSLSMSTWPIPKGSPGVWQALGNGTTCTMQGFFNSMTVSVPFYNLLIALYPVLVARFDWKEEHFRTVEPFMHAVPLTVAIGVSTSGLVLNLFNNANLWCWIAPFPMGCKDSLRHGEEANCIRGDNAWVYRLALAYVPVWFCIVAAMLFMMVVYYTVLQGERDVDKFQQNGTTIRRQSKRVARQALWYVLAFYITWVPATITRVLQMIPATKGEVYFPLIFVMSTSLTMQGFLNFTVFFRARYLKYLREHPGCPKMEALWSATFHQPTIDDEQNELSTSERFTEG